MVARLEKTQAGYAIFLTEEMVEALKLHEGAPVEVLPFSPEIRYASTEDALRAFEESLPRHEAAYRALAKL